MVIDPGEINPLLLPYIEAQPTPAGTPVVDPIDRGLSVGETVRQKLQSGKPLKSDSGLIMGVRLEPSGDVDLADSEMNVGIFAGLDAGNRDFTVGAIKRHLAAQVLDNHKGACVEVSTAVIRTLDDYTPAELERLIPSDRRQRELFPPIPAVRFTVQIGPDPLPNNKPAS